MKVLISGGAKNGKSMYAQRVAKNLAEEKEVPLYYVATMEPVDDEDRARIKRHVEDRAGWGFITIEEPLKLSKIFNGHGQRYLSLEEPADIPDASGVFLVDSLTALLGNNMFRSDGKMYLGVLDEMKEDLDTFSNIAGDIVMVSDFINCDGFDFDEITEKYRENLAMLERFLAGKYDKVVEISAGQIISFKGEMSGEG
ncbi:MAG: bifunctional adenosylcobinamide kinase/adenosylcobinamide-phosphate guanylyltransferase [Anaerovoracaceae bacterium]|nr:bifunctional adenosylcobinamide kinase/adenosylcobinamide-phosphate guanylyltransferase [Anaerovoracaceae bacterium]